MKEELRDIEGFENYKVSNMGYVLNVKRNKVLKPVITIGGYERVDLCKNKKRSARNIHRLVSFAFPEICGEYFEGAEVDHLDGNKRNNKADNLRWATHMENVHNPNTYPIMTKNLGEATKKAKSWVYAIKEHSKPVVCLNTKEYFKTVTEAADKFGIWRNTVIRVCRGVQKQTRMGLRFAYYDGCTEEPLVSCDITSQRLEQQSVVSHL